MTISYLNSGNVAVDNLSKREYRWLKERGYKKGEIPLTNFHGYIEGDPNRPVTINAGRQTGSRAVLVNSKGVPYQGKQPGKKEVIKTRKADYNKKGYAGFKSKGQADQMDYPPSRVGG